MYRISAPRRQHGLLVAVLAVFVQDLIGELGVQAWTYSYSTTPPRNWVSARRWCREHFTDLLAIQNQDEIAYLNHLLPFNHNYYWIGLRKVSGAWTWVGTGKVLTPETSSWAEGEPNSVLDQQSCVEMYIKRDKDAGKWNDEPCRSRKGAICYTASCSQDSCGAHAECVETIGNYTCRCHPGFQGQSCEAVRCEPSPQHQHGSRDCSHPNGPDRFDCTCQFRCDAGFRLVGAPSRRCQASGVWDHPAPLCQAEQCPALSHPPAGGSMNCTHPIAPDGSNSTCEFRCDEGYQLEGAKQIRCERGQWSAAIPSCTAVPCEVLTPPANATMQCHHPVQPNSLGSVCTVLCDQGFNLIGPNTTTCSSGGRWLHRLPTCQAKSCGPIPVPLHGTISCQNAAGNFSFGSKCTTTCDIGFQLDGVSETSCTSAGNWSADVPRCRARRCSVVKPPSHSALSCSHPNEVFSVGSRCTSTCDEGFVRNGTQHVECTSEGTWSGELAKCLAQQCPLLAVAPQHGRMNCSHSLSPPVYGSQCDFECNAGFRLRGAKTRRCTRSGHWDQDQPSCQPAGMSLGSAMLMYTGIGAGTGVALLSLVGLVLLIRKQSKKEELVISDMSAWGGNDNPAFDS